MRRRLMVAATLAALFFTALGPAPARAAATADIGVMWAFLVARGAGVDISYSMTCPEGFTGTVTASLSQVRKDGLVASGTAVDQLNCLGSGTLEMVRVTASIGGAPFRPIKATLAIQVVGCDDQECFSVPVNQDVQIQV